MNKFENKLKMNPSVALESSTKVDCPDPDCDSTLFYPSIQVRKISALLTENGKAAAITQSGPLLCVKCDRPLEDADLGYTPENQEERTDEKEDKNEDENKEENTG